jgi:hypothetical protein
LRGLRSSKSAAHFFGPVPSLRLNCNTARHLLVQFLTRLRCR